MQKIDGSIPNLLQGVSQQPARDRQPGQHELQENMSSDAVRGLLRRSPTELQAVLIPSTDPDPLGWSKKHLYIGDTLYILFYKAGAIRVFRTDGTECTVTSTTEAKAYLSSGDLRHITIDSATYLTNPAKVSAMLPDKFPNTKQGYGLVYLMGGAYGRTFKVTVKNGFDANAVPALNCTIEHSTPDGSTSAHGAQIATTYIADKLLTLLRANADIAGSYVLERASDVIVLKPRKWSLGAVQYPDSRTLTGFGTTSGANPLFDGNTGTATWAVVPASAAVRSVHARMTYVSAVELMALDVWQSAVANPSTWAVEYSDDNGATWTPTSVTATVLGTTLSGTRIEWDTAGAHKDWRLINTATVPLQHDLYEIIPYLKGAAKSVPTDLSITVDDGDGGDKLYSVTSFIGDAAKLPRFAYPDQLVTIKGIEGDADDWYVRFSQTNPGFGNEGIWEECAKWDEPYKFDLTTMPHVLTHVPADDSFTFLPGDWKDRRVGDDNTCPAPSCVGQTINDVSAFQGRLVMATGSAVLMSRTGRHTDLWPKSATTISDSDPIDVESAVKTGIVLERLAPHNHDLVVFAKTAEFIVFGRNALTPKNTSLVLSTSFEAALDAAPVSGGRNVFFCMKYGSFTGIREFYTEDSVDANNSDSITAHVTQYLKGQGVQLIASSNFDTLLVRTTDNKKVLYMYQFTGMGKDKVQSAWSKVIFDADVEYAFFSENVLYLIQTEGNTTFLTFMNLDRLPDDGLTFQVMLDRKTDILNSHITVTKPYNVAGMQFIQGAGCPNPGLVAPVESQTATQAVFKKDMNGGTIICGVPYTSRFIPTRPFMRDKNGLPILNGAMHITKYRAAFANSGPFQVIVTSPHREPAIVQHTGWVVGSVTSRIGAAPISSGNMAIPVRTDPEYGVVEFTCDSYMPFSISGVEWEGQYTKRGQRV